MNRTGPSRGLDARTLLPKMVQEESRLLRRPGSCLCPHESPEPLWAAATRRKSP